jgi:hypothetical protein
MSIYLAVKKIRQIITMRYAQFCKVQYIPNVYEISSDYFTNHGVPSWDNWPVTAFNPNMYGGGQSWPPYVWPPHTRPDIQVVANHSDMSYFVWPPPPWRKSWPHTCIHAKKLLFICTLTNFSKLKLWNKFIICLKVNIKKRFFQSHLTLAYNKRGKGVVFLSLPSSGNL